VTAGAGCGCGGNCGCTQVVPLPDVSGTPLRELAAQAESPALRRILASLEDPNGVISAFTSFVE